jgi:hypothetical protein
VGGVTFTHRPLDKDAPDKDAPDKDAPDKDAPDKDAPVFRPVQRTGIISSHAILSGLHHHYVWCRFSVRAGARLS